MIAVLLLIGAILIVTALRGTQGVLFAALGDDVPPFVVWAAAIVAVGALGYVPGLKGPARILLALVIIVLVLNNYESILAGFGAAASGQGTPQAATPGSASSSANSLGAAGGEAVSSHGINLNALNLFPDVSNSFAGMAGEAA